MPLFFTHIRPFPSLSSTIKSCSRWTSTSAKRHEPLRILFCGADQFSIYSLKALHKLQRAKPDIIGSIDVICRHDKRTGRGFKQVQEVPIKPIAKGLGLNLHQLDTFRDWTPPNSPNLVVAVSFGLLVPGRIIKAAEYGGLNVHPSLLPDLRGPAPIHHALLKGRKTTGVSLQTMHPTKFDHGAVLAQAPSGGLRISDGATPQQLLETLGSIGAEMLAKAIEQGTFIPPVTNLLEGRPEPEDIAHAPKITPEDRHIDWSTWDADDILLRDRVLGRLWDDSTYDRCGRTDADAPQQKAGTRTVFTGPWRIEPGVHVPNEDIGGWPALKHPVTEANELRIGTRSGEFVIPSEATVEGGKKGQGIRTMVARVKKAIAEQEE